MSCYCMYLSWLISRSQYFQMIGSTHLLTVNFLASFAIFIASPFKDLRSAWIY